MAHVPKQQREKWDAKFQEAVLVGFEEETKAYRLYNTKSNIEVQTHQQTTFVSPDFELSITEPDTVENVEPDANLDEVPAVNENVDSDSENETDFSQYYSQVEGSEEEASNDSSRDIYNKTLIHPCHRCRGAAAGSAQYQASWKISFQTVGFRIIQLQ